MMNYIQMSKQSGTTIFTEQQQILQLEGKTFKKKWQNKWFQKTGVNKQ